jgi:hypothetical protein
MVHIGKRSNLVTAEDTLLDIVLILLEALRPLMHPLWLMYLKTTSFLQDTKPLAP